MDRLQCSVVILLLLAYCSSLAINSDQAEDSQVEKKNGKNMDAKIEDLRNKHEIIVDEQRESQHPFAWGLRRYKYEVAHPFGWVGGSLRDVSAIDQERRHPFGFELRDHPFGFNLQRK